MTHDELMALRDVTYPFDYERIPIMDDDARPLWQPPNEPMMVTDCDGTRWVIGYLGTERVRRRIPGAGESK